jgi:hypothetical protein
MAAGYCTGKHGIAKLRGWMKMQRVSNIFKAAVFKQQSKSALNNLQQNHAEFSA